MVSKVVSLPIIGCLLLSNVASADEEESQSNLRKLDVVVSLEASRLEQRLPLAMAKGIDKKLLSART